jgi:hypothetical protein
MCSVQMHRQALEVFPVVMAMKSGNVVAEIRLPGFQFYCAMIFKRMNRYQSESAEAVGIHFVALYGRVDYSVQPLFSPTICLDRLSDLRMKTRLPKTLGHRDDDSANGDLTHIFSRPYVLQ